jgi:microtubule-associated protein-like 6
MAPSRAEPTLDPSKGRLSANPLVGGATNALPCSGSIVAPMQYPHVHLKDATACPDDTLKLEFVHGYRAHDTRSNLSYDKTGKLCYHAAALGIVMHPTTRKQVFFKGHSDDVMCLAMHPGGELVATGWGCIS